jgi:uncharacterized membrane protein YdbT with pleckstrin-like domain
MTPLKPPPEGLMPGVSGAEELIYEGSPAAIRGFGQLVLCILTLGIWGIVLAMQANAVRYKITSQRVVIERGFFSKRMEQIDLYRVVDYVVDRPFGQRLMGTGNIVLEAMDKTTPEVRIDGLKTDVVALYERLRFCTEQEKKRRNVRVLDVEPV